MKGNVTIMVAIILIVFILISLYNGITGKFILIGEEFKKDLLPSAISKLPEISFEDVKTYQQYKEFADKTNELITILNREAGLNIPTLETSTEAWSDISRKINKYAPLINNYKELIESARKFEKYKTKENYKDFYLKLGKFSLETTLIYTAIFHGVSFKTVGEIYRSSGLNLLAFKCPTCVSIVLSGAYWTIRTVLVEESSKVAEKMLNGLTSYINLLDRSGMNYD